jgi:diketogulonate reductase-like aldo/keto reductase
VNRLQVVGEIMATLPAAFTLLITAFLIMNDFVRVLSDVPSVPLANGAKNGVRMPVVGIGTAGYGPPGEIWNDSIADKAVTEFLKLGGRRIDTSLDYSDQKGIGQAIKASGVSREDIFITSKVGGGPPGYNAAMDQIDLTLQQLDSSYVDLLLIHWPGPINSSDAECNNGSTEAEKGRSCRQATWRALEKIFQEGKAMAIGVSNFEQNHLQDIIDMNGTLPAVDQVEFQPYWHEFDLVHFCQGRNITFNGYAPLGTPDWAPITHDWPGHNTTMQQPTIVKIAQEHDKTPAQVILRWQWQLGIVLNPRSENPEHMKENLDIFDFSLSDAEMQQMTQIPAPDHPKVTPDPHMYP